MRRNLSTLVICAAICLLLAVPAAASWQGERVTKDGVAYIQNPATPINAPKTAKMQELWRIGGDTDDVDQFFGVISQILVGPDGNLYILDSQLNQVKIFTPDGEFLRDIGREGEGPGEFRFPASMFFTADGDLAVMQTQPGKIVLLSTEGEPMGEHPLPQSEDAGFLTLAGGQSRGGNIVLVVAKSALAEGQWSQDRFLCSIDAEGKEKTRYCGDTRTIVFADPVMSDKMWDTFDRRWEVSTDGSVYAAPSYDNYEIHVWNAAGDLQYVIAREYKHRKRTAEEIEMMKNMFSIFARQIPNSTVKITDMTKDVEDFFIRDDGSIWVLTSDGARDNPEGTIGVFDVFDREGRYTHQVTLEGEGNPLTDGYYFVGDRIYIVTDLLQAAVSLQAGGESFQVGDEEPEPMAVITYRLDGNLLTSSR